MSYSTEGVQHPPLQTTVSITFHYDMQIKAITSAMIHEVWRKGGEREMVSEIAIFTQAIKQLMHCLLTNPNYLEQWVTSQLLGDLGMADEEAWRAAVPAGILAEETLLELMQVSLAPELRSILEHYSPSFMAEKVLMNTFPVRLQRCSVQIQPLVPVVSQPPTPAHPRPRKSRKRKSR